MTRPIGIGAIRLVKRWEGCRLEAYQDVAGVWTIGWGTTAIQGVPVKQGDKITRKEADELLYKQVQSHAGRMLLPYDTMWELSQHQYDALASFHYNLGAKVLRDSDLREMLIKGHYEDAVKEMKIYNGCRILGDYVILEGLTKRREKEAKVFKRKDGRIRNFFYKGIDRTAIAGYAVYRHFKGWY